MLRTFGQRLPTAVRRTVPQNRQQAARCLFSSAAIEEQQRPAKASGDVPPPVRLQSPFAAHRRHSAADGFVWSSPYGRIDPPPDMTLDEYVWKNVAKWPNKVALVCGVTGRKYTYARLRDHCAAVAVRLRTEYGLRRGDVVAIAMPNVPEYAIVALGALEAGLTLTTVNPLYTPAEHSKQLLLARPKLLFGLTENVATLRQALAGCDGQLDGVPIVAVRTHVRQELPDGVRDFAELMNLKGVEFGALGQPEHRPSDICMLPFSSGTTGLPKGVRLTHSNITANCEQMDVPLPEQRTMLPTTNDFQDVVPAVLPFFHIYGFVFLLASKLALGCKIVTLPRFEPDRFLTLLAEHKATFLAVVPPLLLFLGNSDLVQPRHVSNLRMVMCGAAASGSADADRFREKKARSVQFMQGYGMTETSPLAIISTLPNVNYDSIGRPAASTEVKIAHVDDPTGFGLDAHETGELLVRGPQVMHGYLNDEAATAAIMAPGGWLRTGDIGRYEADGSFYISDRAKELIKVDGLQVAPAELEAVLRSHPLVLDAGVVGLPHQRHGEVPRAYVKVRQAVRAAELETFVAERVAKFKRLAGGVQLVDEVPRSGTGKILRRELKRLYQ